MSPWPAGCSVGGWGSLLNPIPYTLITFRRAGFVVVSAGPLRARYEIMFLKVIHRRRRTGFEETKDFPIRVNDLIAGRYQVLLQASNSVSLLSSNPSHTPSLETSELVVVCVGSSLCSATLQQSILSLSGPQVDLKAPAMKPLHQKGRAHSHEAISHPFHLHSPSYVMERPFARRWNGPFHYVMSWKVERRSRATSQPSRRPFQP